MRNTLTCLCLALSMALASAPSALAQAAAPDVGEVASLRRQANNPAEKKALVASLLALTDAEAKRFWPVYDSYQRKLEANNRRWARAVQDVVATDKPISDPYARNLVKELAEIEDAETRARKALYTSAVKALPGRKAVRYVQIESKLQTGYQYEVASALPLVK